MLIKLNPDFSLYSQLAPVEKIRKLAFIVCQMLFKAFIHMLYHVSSLQQLEVLSQFLRLGNQCSKSSVTKELQMTGLFNFLT